MQEQLDNKNILIYSTQFSNCKSVTAASMKKMTAKDSKFYLSYLNKLLDQYNNTSHYVVNKKPINADYSALTEEIETNP